MDFETCVRLAIQQSPYLVKSSVEIDIRHMDETDSRYALVPPLTFRSSYYVNTPRQFGSHPQPYTLNFSTEPYNPFKSYMTLQAQKLATQMSVFAHLKLVCEGLERMGRMFLDLAGMKRVAAFQADLVKLTRENLTYAENRLNIGTGTSLEVKVASQEMALAKNEKERLEITQKHTLTSLKNFLGLKQDAPLELNLRDARRQVLGGFDPAAALLEQARARSYDLKALELRNKMQGYNIMVAKARVLPTITFNTQTPDPLNFTTSRGLFMSFGLDVPVWDGFSRIRNVSRQKAVLKQFDAEKEMKEFDLTDKWNSCQEEINTASATLKIAQSQEELARLKERQGEIRYQSGTEPLPVWLDARKANLEAQKNVAAKTLECDEKVLTLRQLSGDLGNSYVDPKSWQK